MPGPVSLIVGCDGQVGAALVRALQERGKPVIGSTRRAGPGSEQRLNLDLRSIHGPWRPPFPVDVAAIAAAITSLEACERDPSGTAETNVRGTINLIEGLTDAGAFVVFLSTNLVFDGATPFVSPDAPLAPMCEYGRQKAEVERRISPLAESISIVRFSKILGPRNPLFDAWSQALRRGGVIRPFSDAVISPIPLAFAVEVLCKVMDGRLSGILQVSAEEDVSYAEVALEGARAIGADPGLVKPVLARESGRAPVHVPRRATLDTSRLQQELGLSPPAARRTALTAFLKPGLLAESPAAD